MMYGAQAWGYEKYETVDKLLRFYLKRCFLLPRHTPNNMLHIETGLPPLFIKTLKLHVDNHLKVSKMQVKRLPKIISRHIIRRKSLYFGKLKELADYCGLDFNLSLQGNYGREVEDALYDLASEADENF